MSQLDHKMMAMARDIFLMVISKEEVALRAALKHHAPDMKEDQAPHLECKIDAYGAKSYKFKGQEILSVSAPEAKYDGKTISLLFHVKQA